MQGSRCCSGGLPADTAHLRYELCTCHAFQVQRIIHEIGKLHPLALILFSKLYQSAFQASANLRGLHQCACHNLVFNLLHASPHILQFFPKVPSQLRDCSKS